MKNWVAVCILSFVLTGVSWAKEDALTASEDAGIVAIRQSLPMSIESVAAAQWVGPALIRKETNPVLKIQVNTAGALDPMQVASVTIGTDGTTDLNDIELVRFFFTGGRGDFSPEQEFGSAQRPSSRITFSGQRTLTEGVNNFWVSYKLKDTADLLHRVNAACLEIAFVGQDGGRKIVRDVVSPPAIKRIGYSIRDAGDDGVPAYRIPGLVATNQNTLIAVYDIRRHGMADLPGDIDIGMSRSTDGGQSWEPMKVIMDMGVPHNRNGVGDPSILVDRSDNTLWVAALWSKGSRGWAGSGPGMTPDETGQLMLVKSTDDGKTWSSPINITPQIKDSRWRLLLQGPGNGITMRNGTLVFPAQFKDENNVPHSTLIYSGDHGRTWAIGTGAKSKTTEAQIVELNNGLLMLNMRDDRGGSRSVYTTADMGKTWQEHPTSRSALPESVCMASFIRFSSVKDGDPRDILLFSNPAVTGGRQNITIKASMDEGMTWPERYYKRIHEPGSAGYSCLTKIDNNTVGILYEGGTTALLVFEKFRIDEIVAD